MNQLKRKTSNVVTKLVSTMTMFALLVTSIAVSPAVSADAAKVTVKSVSVTKPATKTLVLKKGQSFALKTSVSVKPNKASNKKVSFKSSKSSVVSVSAKGKVVAKGNGSAVITVTSKANTKKVAKITVKVGTPITKVSLNSKSKSLNVGATYTLKATISPKKPTVKSVVWSSSNKKVATVTSKGKVTAKGAGTATITALAGDGSGKLAKCKVTVTGAPTPTPTIKPTPTPDTREKVIVQDFQNIDLGPIATDEASKLNLTYGGRDITTIEGAKVEVVVDPANASNKLLKVSISTASATQYSGYDLGPVVRVDLEQDARTKGTKLGDYEAISFMTRVVSNSDHTYKRAVAYFAPYKTLNYNYVFSTYDTIAAGESQEKAKYKQFFIENPMARSKVTGKDENGYIDDPMDSGNAYMPQMKDGVTADEGFSETKEDIPLVKRTLQFIRDNMKFDSDGDNKKDIDLTEASSFDVVLGSTYPETNPGERTVWYLDDVALVKSTTGLIPATGISLNKPTVTKFVNDTETLIASMVPAGTTDKTVWSSSDPTTVAVDDSGKITCIKVGTATITVAIKGNDSIKASCVVTVADAPKAQQINVVLDSLQLKGDSAAYGTKVANADGSVTFTYSAKNQCVIFDLGQTYDLSLYKEVQIEANPKAVMTFELYDATETFGTDYYKNAKFTAYPFSSGTGSKMTETISLNKGTLNTIKFFSFKTGDNAAHDKTTAITIYSVKFIPKNAQ